MRSVLIFLIGLTCGIILYSFTDTVKTAWLNTSAQPAISKNMESSNLSGVTQKTPKATVELPKNDTPTPATPETYWRSKAGFKFKDVVVGDVIKTYVWDKSTKRWLDTGCEATVSH